MEVLFQLHGLSLLSELATMSRFNMPIIVNVPDLQGENPHKRNQNDVCGPNIQIELPFTPTMQSLQTKSRMHSMGKNG
jgi:hypothetical protein